MLVFYNIRWAGTPEEFKELIVRMRGLCNEMEHVDFKNVYIPSSEWTHALLYKTKSIDNMQELYGRYIQTYGPTKILLAAYTIYHKYEELGLPPP